jgi:hypothetical protein
MRRWVGRDLPTDNKMPGYDEKWLKMEQLIGKTPRNGFARVFEKYWIRADQKR